MTPYKNLGGDSGVTFYETYSDSIVVKFRDNSTYTYTHSSAGREAVEHMKILAATGRGLNAFINRWVKKAYASKTSSGRSANSGRYW